MNQLTVAQKTIVDLQEAMESMPALTTNMREYTDHFFAPGIYLRTLFVPKGHVVVSMMHKHKTLNIILKGKASIVTSGGVEIIAEAPFIFTSEPGQKAGYAIENVWYAAIHPNPDDITDIEQLEQLFMALTYKELEVLP